MLKFLFALLWPASSVFVLRSNNDPTRNITIPIGKYLTLDEMIAVECPMLFTGGPVCYPSMGARVISDVGRRIYKLEDIAAGEVVHMVGGGTHFAYHQPIGKEFLSHAGLKMVQLSYRPRIFSFSERVISDEDISVIIANASSRLYPSTVGDETAHAVTAHRKSFNTVDGTSPVYHKMRQMANRVLSLDPEPNLVEPMQVVRYLPGEYYMPHTDYFQGAQKYDPTWRNGTNRFATLFMYLNDVPDGGETLFPLSVEQRYTEWNFEIFLDECVPSASSIKFRPKKGTGILFYSQHPNGTLDVTSTHGACPPIRGVKWAANLWIWNRPRTEEAGECAVESEKEVKLQIRNDHDGTLNVYWYADNSQGCDTAYSGADGTLIAVIPEKSAGDVKSYNGHLFRMFNEENEMVKCFVVGEES
jgi:prolyl 4-hydroxylase